MVRMRKYNHYGSYCSNYCCYLYVSVLLLIIPLFLFYFNLFDFEDDNNNFIYAQAYQKEDNKKNNISKIHIVTIPKGSANPSIDVTNLQKREWYIPSKIEIESTDVVKWINNDTEAHTVTSGVGSGIQSLLTNDLGKSNGIFNSGLFGSGKSWSYNFTNKFGVFTYFCTIHPWMTGAVDVKESQNYEQRMMTAKNIAKPIPNYPVDDKGNKISVFPVHTLSNDQRYDIDMSWSPKVLQTDETSTFILNFFEMPSNKRLHLLPFDIEILQNNKTLETASGITEVGSGTFQYTFSESGPVTVKIENVGNTPAFTQFNTLVYQNPNATSTLTDSTSNDQATNRIIAPVAQYSNSLISPILLVSLTYVIIIALPVAAGTIIVLFKKGII